MPSYPSTAGGGGFAPGAYDRTKAFAAGDLVRHNGVLYRAPANLPVGRFPRRIHRAPVAGVTIEQHIGARAILDSITGDLSNWSAGGFPGRGYLLDVITATTVELTNLILDGGAALNMSIQEYLADGTTFVSAFTTSGDGTQATRVFNPGVHYCIVTCGSLPANRDGANGYRIRTIGGSLTEYWESV